MGIALNATLRRCFGATAAVSVAALTLVQLVSGCGDGSIQPKPFGPVDVQALTPQIRATLVHGGYFPEPAVEFPSPLSTAARADSLARAFVKTFGAARQSSWSLTADADVHASTLTRCGMGETALARFTQLESSASRLLINTVAPAYMAHFCDALGVPRVLVSVALTGVAEISPDGSLVPFSVEGGTFFSSEIPMTMGGGAILLSPERAAELAYRSTGRRVASIPVLVMPPFLDAPYFARWRVMLEASVRLVDIRAETTVVTDVVFVGLDESVHPLSGPRLLIGKDFEGRAGWTDTLLDAGSTAPMPAYVLAHHRMSWPRVVGPAVRPP